MIDFDAFDESWNETEGFDPLEGLVNDDDNTQNNNDDEEAGATSMEPYFAETTSIADFPEPVVQNVISSVNLSTELDLRLIAISARNAEYNPTKVNAVVVRLRNPKCTGLLFRSGRIMITGARSEMILRCVDCVMTFLKRTIPFWILLSVDSHVGGKKIAKLCLKVGHPMVRFRGFKVENMIASVDCGFPVRLEGIANDHSSYCSYEPEMFCGLVYRYNPSDNHKAVLLVFVSGKVILTGCRTVEQIHQVFRAIFPVLSQYKK